MKYLSLLVFVAGAATLGVELSAARLLEPWFGNSQIVWSALIGVVLLYLALGGWLGGQLADRYPDLGRLLTLVALAAIGVGAIPLVSPPILRAAALGLGDYAIALLIGTLLAVLVIFSAPIVLLGAVTPWAIRIGLSDPRQAGQVAGRLYALATLGSLVGTFLPVLWLIPNYGTRWSFFFFAFSLLGVVIVGLLLTRKWMPVGLLGALFVILLITATLVGSRPIDGQNPASGELLYEDESTYGYISVRQWGSERHLKLNEGIGIHSVYHPDSLLSLGIWDYFLLAPFFQPSDREFEDDRVLVVGLAAGTVPALFQKIYGPIEVVGIELDPAIIEVGQTYFDMDDPNLTAIAADGRRWLQQQPADERFDFILIDAYRPPYIPFHLTTIEFFEEVSAHLTDDGVVAINVGRTDTNFTLVNALSATLAKTFANVYVLDEPGPVSTLANSLVVATKAPVTKEEVLNSAEELLSNHPAEFQLFVDQVIGDLRAAHFPDGTPVLTDDRAPIEQIVHGLILDYLFGVVGQDAGG